MGTHLAVDGFNFWNRATKLIKANHKPMKVLPISVAALEKTRTGYCSLKCKAVAAKFYVESHQELYSAFEEHRYEFKPHESCEKTLGTGRTNTSMGVPEEFGALYNQLLEHLYSYGVNVSLSDRGTSHDFTIKGFLFASTPEDSKELLEKLKFVPSTATYTAPST